MPEAKLMINDVDIYENTAKIEAVAVYEDNILSPKARVVFRSNNDIRRMPLTLKSTFKKENCNKHIAVFSYTYQLDYIFNSKNNSDDISLSFELSFGDNCVENIPFVISEGMFTKYKKSHIKSDYIAGAEFEGTMAYSSSDEQPPEVEPEFIYTCNPEPQNNKFIIQKKPNKKYIGDTAGTKIYNFLSAFFTIFYGILLLPYFIIDGFLAGINAAPRRNYPPVQGALRNIIGQIKTNIAFFIKSNIKDRDTAMKIIAFREEHYCRYYRRLCKKPVVENRISFISGRRDEIGGNEKYVYDLIKNNKDIDFQFLMSTDLDRFTKGGKKRRFYQLYASSKIVIVDDYYNMLNTVEKRDDVTLFQLWHACGAFKTFGFSRLGKSGSPKQKSPNHRMYDYTIVSSADIVKYYAEGFGISDNKVLPTGIPRTDIFYDKEYALNIKTSFYEKYPTLKGKKLILFAPTFRGTGQKSAFYPLAAFDPNKMYEKIGTDYAILIKLHPFCNERYTIKAEYKDYIIDLSQEDELNDLLFVTDLLITDYSSCVFEASLLDIPMLFYAFDLYHYIADRDFYCDYESFVPGKMVFNQNQIAKAIINKDYEAEKVEPFKHKFFTEIDGKSSKRVADEIMKAYNS